MKAVIFDLDGVLVDSEWASSEAWRTALAGFGFRIDEANVESFVGTTDRALADFFSVHVGEEPSTVLKAAEREMRRKATGGLVAYPDALSVLDRLVIPSAVASNSDRWRLELVLIAAGIRDRFEVSVAGDEVPFPKPAPDIYLRGAALLDVDAGDCLVIEDSPTGLTAARAAGMKVVAVRRGYFEDEELSLADEIVDSVDSSSLLTLLTLRDA